MHLILISLDTLRGDCVGNQKLRYLPSESKKSFTLKSTFLDEIAHSGLHFTKAFSAAPYTTGSHASIFTGYFPLRHGLYGYYNAPFHKKSIFEIAQDENWTTIFNSDFPIMFSQALGFHRGIDHYTVEDENKALWTLGKNIKSNTLSFFHFGGIHYPYGFHKLKFAHDDYETKVEDLEKELHLHNKNLPLDQLSETYRDAKDHELLLRYKYVIETLYKQKKYDRLTALYIEGIDYFLNNRFYSFFNELKKVISSQEHVIIIFGDHGEEWSDTSEGHYKTLSAGVLNVPIIIIGNEINPQVIESNVRTVDIAATVFSYLRSEDTESRDGVPLIPNISQLGQLQLTSYAQTWLGIGKDALDNHIKNAMNEGHITHVMNLIKRGESIIENNFQLLRLYDKTGKKISDKAIHIDTHEPIAHQVYKTLDSKLKLYNSQKSDTVDNLTVENDLKEQLRLMGYEI